MRFLKGGFGVKMENDLKKIKCVEDLAIELLGIFKDGMLARIIAGKTKPLTYRISRLQYWALKDGVQIKSINELIDICNGYIKNDNMHYEIIGRLGIKGENIIALVKG